MLRRPPYPEGLETTKEIEQHGNQLLDMDVIRNMGHNEIVEVTTFVLITCHDSRYGFCGDFRGLKNYTKADRYPIPRILHAVDKLEKAKYIRKMDFMKFFHKNGFKKIYMKLLKGIFHMDICKYTRREFGIKNAPSHFQRMIDTILKEDMLEGRIVVYIDVIII
ncbi:hypothetical protein O181_063422 [Austropuccinia psidii MF-1]|uniref:Reverse transcriptase domain-containing protein n=1 Tax=Austropuccinia psidii MF-1 TaxID=1389203 RepID=A0A9Q3I1C8_9BASI|nr:hypothetical protein [Austropuccinia psidii MF-1]